MIVISKTRNHTFVYGLLADAKSSRGDETYLNGAGIKFSTSLRQT